MHLTLLLLLSAAPEPKRLKRCNAFHEGLVQDWRGSLLKRKSTGFCAGTENGLADVACTDFKFPNPLGKKRRPRINLLLDLLVRT
jgi:hypothetical protein